MKTLRLTNDLWRKISGEPAYVAGLQNWKTLAV